MDKYTSKTSFQEWVSSIKLRNLSTDAQTFITNYDYYSKKLDFQTTLNILLHAVYEEYPSYREMSRAFLDQRLCSEIGIDSVDHSNLSHRLIPLSSWNFSETSLETFNKNNQQPNETAFN